MKISSASKKVLASALSAAMVVAFAPTVAFGAVSTDSDKTDASGSVVAGDEVASVTYYTVKDGKTTENVQKFYSNDADTDDNALQAAAAFAGGVKNTKAGTAVTVKLNKDVKVATPYAQGIKEAVAGDFSGTTGSYKTQKGVTYYTVSQNEAGKYEASELEVAAGTKVTVDGPDYKYDGKVLYVTDTDTPKAVMAKAGATADAATAYVHDTLKLAGKVTLDLNGHTLSNSGVNTVELAAQNLDYTVAGDAVTKTVTTFVDSAAGFAQVKNEESVEKAITDAVEAYLENYLTGDYQFVAATWAYDGGSASAAVINGTSASKMNITNIAVTFDYKQISTGVVQQGDTRFTAGNSLTLTIDRALLDKAIIAANVEKYDADAAKASFDKVTVESADANNAKYKTGSLTGVTAISDELTGGLYSAADDGTFRKYTAKYTVSQKESTKTYKPSAALDVTIADSAEAKGAVKASKKSAIDVNAGTLTINGAAVSSENAAAAVTADDGSLVKLKGGATVAATLEGYIEATGDKVFSTGTNDVNDVFGINSAGTVTVVEATDAEVKANKDAAYDKVANVTATLTKGAATAYVPATGTAPAVNADAAVATAVKAKTLNVLRNAEFTATSEAAASSGSATAGGNGTTDADSGVIKPSKTASLAKSVAVDVTAAGAAATLNYGTYDADFAVENVANGGTANAVAIKSGAFKGYVENVSETNVLGGKFKYDPTSKAEYVDENNNEAVAQAAMGDAAAFKAGADLRVAKGSELFYVYRAGTYAGNEADASIANNHVTFDLAVPAGSKKASGAEYQSADTTAYIQDKYMDSKTQSVVLSEDAVGIALNDGNKTDRLELATKTSYANPYSEQDKAKNPEAFAAIEKQATSDFKHVAGLYTVAAQLNYGTDPATGKPVKYQDVADLGGVALSYKLGPATIDSVPVIYTVAADGTCTALETKTPDAIVAGALAWANATSDKLGTMGLTYSTAEDLKNEAASKGEEIVAEKATQSIEVAKKSMTVKVGSKSKTSKGKSFNIGADAETAVTASKKSGSSKITVTEAGKVKLAKGAVKGKTYTAKVSLKAAGSDAYLAAAKTITVKFTIKK